MDNEFGDLFDRPIPADVVSEFLEDIQKLAQEEALGPQREHARDLVKSAVSANWVSDVARNAARKSSPSRVREVAGGTMKGVLDAVKKKGPNAQAHVDKRMALHNAMQGRVSSLPPPMKVASDKTAVSTQFMQRAAASASPERLAGAHTSAINRAHQIVQRGTGSVADAKAYRSQHRLANVISDTMGRGKAAAFSGTLEPTAEQVAMAEQQGLLHQALAENQALQGAVQQAQGQMAEHAQAAEQAGAQVEQLGTELQGAQQQAEQLTMQAQESMAQAQQAQTEAQVHAQNAAQQADGKMRLAIRIQQMRQNMADLASQDPVTEEGESAEPIETATQQGAAEEEAAMQEQAAAEQEAAAAEGQAAATPEAKKKTAALRMLARAAELGGNEKLAAAVDLAKKKGFFGRAGQLLSGSRARNLDAAADRQFGREMRTLRRAPLRETPAQVTRRDKVLDRLDARKTKLRKARDEELGKSVATQVGTGFGTAGAVAGGVHLATRDKQSAPIGLGTAKDVMGRAAQIATGDRAAALVTAAERNAARAGRLNPANYIGDAKDLKRVGAVRQKLEARAARLQGMAKTEQGLDAAAEVKRMHGAQQPGFFGRMMGKKPAAAPAPTAAPKPAPTVGGGAPVTVAPVTPAPAPAAAPAAAGGPAWKKPVNLAAGGLAVGAGGMYALDHRNAGAPAMAAYPKVASFGYPSSLVKLADEARKKRIAEQMAKNKKKGVQPIQGAAPTQKRNISALARSHRRGGGAHEANRVFTREENISPEIQNATRNMKDFKANGGVSSEGKRRQKNVQDFFRRAKERTDKYHAEKAHYTAKAKARRDAFNKEIDDIFSRPVRSSSNAFRSAASKAPQEMKGRHLLAGLAGAGAVAGLGYLASRKGKQQPKQQGGRQRRKAAAAAGWDDHPAMRKGRNSATLAGVLAGGTAGAVAGGAGHELASMLGKKPQKRHIATLAAAGAALGGLHSRARFNTGEAKKDIGVYRALAKERASRHEKAHEKRAMAAELSDADIDALYAL